MFHPPMAQKRWLNLLATACWVACLAASPALALHPESPEVKAAVKKALAYLEKNYQTDIRTGAYALTGLCFIKNDHENPSAANHAVVQAAVRKVRTALATHEGDFNDPEMVYNLGISVIFFANLPDAQYKGDLEKLIGRLVACQKPHGGWGYPHSELGDNSMTQYGALGLWEAYRAGATAPLNSFEKCCNFLINVQDPSGGFGYQAKIGSPGKLVPQDEIKHSLSAAGMGGLYICLDHFEFGPGTQAGPKQVDVLPKDLHRVKAPEKIRERRRTTAVDQAKLKASIALGDAWFAKNDTMDPTGWLHYFLYGFERYKSFKEAAELTDEKEPKWYTDWAKRLIATQDADGSWTSQAGAVPDTALATLFLLRSTKKSIQAALGPGSLVGGRGIPKDASDVEVVRGNVVKKKLSGPADQLLSIMEDPADPKFEEAVSGLLGKVLEPDEALLPQQLLRLRKLIDPSKPPAARAVALLAIAKQRNLDDVPLLIFALGDDDLQVVAAARDGLRYISRKFFVEWPAIPEVFPDAAARQKWDVERRKAIEQWKAWYLSIRPDYQFED